MAYVQCEVQDGLRASEATVSVTTIDGDQLFLRVERDFVQHQGDKNLLPIGIVFSESDRTLIELPHESDSGMNRLWVRPEQLN
jgi:hypothetical protein